MKMSSPISKQFSKFLSALRNESKISNKDITYQIFYDMFLIRSALEKYNSEVKRGKSICLSEIFQDLVAHYLRILLPKEYEVFCEMEEEKIRPDILIKKNGKAWSCIELKTTIGFNRGLIENRNYLKRLEDIRKIFHISPKRVFYIFESASNAGAGHLLYKVYSENQKHHMRNYIYPLFLKSAWPSLITDVHKRHLNKQIYKLYNDNKLEHSSLKVIIKKIKG